MLAETIQKRQSRTIEAAQMIEELVRMAQDFKKPMSRGKELA